MHHYRRVASTMSFMYTHLCLEEREHLAVLQGQGKSQRKIARIMCRSQSSISWELKRNKRYGNEYLWNTYIPCKADTLATTRACFQRTKAPLKNVQVFLYVREHLRPPYSWSPQQIAGRLSIDYPNEYVSHETIYQYIYGKGKRFKLMKYLPLARKKRMKKEGRRVQRIGKIPFSISIDERPEEVTHRLVAGHWETDNLGGKVHDTTTISTTIERVSRFVFIDKLDSRTASSKSEALIKRFTKLPLQLKRTITTDNGAENTNHTHITQVTHIPFYFCHPYHS